MDARYQQYRQTRFFGSLDGLRAISIIGVIWFHSWFGTPQFATLLRLPVLRSGPFGVDIFFTISGFLITTLLLRERDRNGAISLRNFYVRRALRILPLYFGVLLLYVVLVSLTMRHALQGRLFYHYLPTYATFTYTWFGPDPGQAVPPFNFAWSLATEEQFYLFWPFVLCLTRGAWPAICMAGLIALSLVANLAFGPAHAAAALHLPLKIAASLSVPICLGALLALMLHHPRGFGIAWRVLGRRAAAPLALAAMLAALGAAGFLGPHGAALAWITLPALIGACVIREDNGLAPFLRLRFMVTVGVLSYGMYLFNTLAVKAARPALARVGLHHPLEVFPVVLGLTIAIEWVSYRYYESFFLSLKQRFSKLRPMPTLPELGAEVSSAVPAASVHP